MPATDTLSIVASVVASVTNPAPATPADPLDVQRKHAQGRQLLAHRRGRVGGPGDEDQPGPSGDAHPFLNDRLQSVRPEAALQPRPTPAAHAAAARRPCRARSRPGARDRTAVRCECRCRAGIKGTLSLATRILHLRRSCYIGPAKTHLQHVLTATMNLDRISNWLAGTPSRTDPAIRLRPSHGHASRSLTTSPAVSRTGQSHTCSRNVGRARTLRRARRTRPRSGCARC